jgi:hypothetical protein
MPARIGVNALFITIRPLIPITVNLDGERAQEDVGWRQLRLMFGKQFDPR